MDMKYEMLSIRHLKSSLCGEDLCKSFVRAISVPSVFRTSQEVFNHPATVDCINDAHKMHAARRRMSPGNAGESNFQEAFGHRECPCDETAH